MKSPTPFSLLLAHRIALLQVFEQNNRNSLKTWDVLTSILPLIGNSMSLNTFKQYFPLLVITHNKIEPIKQELEEVRQELDKMRNEKLALEIECHTLHERLDKVRQNQSLLIEIENSKTSLNDRENVVERVRQIDPEVRQKKLDKVRQPQSLVRQKKLDKTQSVNSSVISSFSFPKRLAGWCVRKSKDGYYRAYRKVHNVVHSVYLGKKPELENAQQRILKKERELDL